MRKIGPVCSFLFFFIFSLVSKNGTGLLYAQHNNFQTYSYEQGLSQSTIFCIIQDKRGYLWLGTDKGLVRFDGINFKTYDKTRGFDAGVVRSLMEDKLGRIWIGTQDEGILIFDGVQFKKIDRKSGLRGSSVLCLLEDNKGSVWAGTDDAGLNKITLVKDSLAIDVFDESKGLGNNSVMDICQTQNDEIWLATFGGIHILSEVNGKTGIRYLSANKEIPASQFTAILEDKEGTIWCAAYNGSVFSLSPKAAGQWTAAEHNLSNGFGAKAIWKIAKTRSGELWFASMEDGVIRCKADPKKFVHYTNKDGLPGNQVFCIYEDSEGDTWIGTNGKGLCKFGGDVFAHYNERDGLPGNSIAAVTGDQEGNIWVGTTGSVTGGLVQVNLSGDPYSKTYSVADGLPGNSVNGISIGRTEHNKRIWLALGPDGIARFDPDAPKGKKFTGYSEAQGLLSGFVYAIHVDQNGIVWCGTSEGISRFDGVKFLNITMEAMKFKDKGVYAIIQDRENNLWFGTEGGLAEYGGNGQLTTYDEAEGLLHKEVNSLAEDKQGNIWIGTVRNGLYFFDKKEKGKKKIRFFAGDSLLGSGTIKSLVFQDNNDLLVGTDKGFCRLTFDKGNIASAKQYDASNGFIGVEGNDNAVWKDPGNNTWFGTFNGLTRFDPAAEVAYSNPPYTHITDIKLFFKDVNWSERTDSVIAWSNLPQSLVLDHTDNHLTFEFTAISLRNPRQVKYKYMLEGVDKDWSPERKETNVTFSGLAPGIYTFKLIAAGENGVWNQQPVTFKFTITPPWYKTKLFYGISVLLLVLFIYTFIKYRERALVREKNILENKVTERTAEVVRQKEHIEEQKKEITDSINYAKRIQGSVLPPLAEVSSALPGSFVLFKPKDIVSGDFYWYYSNDKRTILAAADCTGHGVPGAFMSMLGSEKLNEAVLKTHEPGKILQQVNQLIRKVLRQSAQENSTRDGMDIALLAFNKEISEVTYAGANRPLWIVRSGTTVIEEIKATKSAIGGFTEDHQEFAQHTVTLKKGDTLYVFSDGYADQFGSGNKKFMTRKFKEVLLSIQQKTMHDQRSILDNTLEDWRGDMEQTDDILVIGVRV